MTSKIDRFLDEIRDEDGRLGRRFPYFRWNVPKEVRLNGLKLIATRSSRKSVSAPINLLEKFIALETPSEILGFASSYGPLHICEQHRLPVNQPHERDKDCVAAGLQQRPNGSQVWIEPIDAWIECARQARAAMRCAVELHAGARASSDDLKLILRHPNDASQFQTVDDQRSALGAFIEKWLWYSDVRPHFIWNDTNPDLGFGGFGLFGALALQLAFAVNRSVGMVDCSECGRLYSPKRRPRAGERRYCEDCQKSGAPERYASLRLRRGETKPRQKIKKGVQSTRSRKAKPTTRRIK